MPANVEIKAVVRDVPEFRKRVEEISEIPGELIPQEDIFFRTEKGRLKLRLLAARNAQLIYYERSDDKGPKRSDYYIFETDEPERLQQLLAIALGVRGIVRKQRWFYRVANTRIHLDEVEELGTFMELEVVLPAGASTKEGLQTANELMVELNIQPKDLIKGAYIDLLGNLG